MISLSDRVVAVLSRAAAPGLATQLPLSALAVQQVAVGIQARADARGPGDLASVVTGQIFALPGGGSSTGARATELAQHLAVLRAAGPVALSQVGIALDVLAECLWTIFGHVVGVAAAAHGTQQQRASDTSTDDNVSAARVALREQGDLARLAASSWMLLGEKAVRIFDPEIHGAQLLAWCERLAATSSSDDHGDAARFTSVVNETWQLLGYSFALLQRRSQLSHATDVAAAAAAPAYFTAAATQFLGPAARAIARADHELAATWCETALLAVLQMVRTDMFDNAHEVQCRLLFEFVGDVLRRFDASHVPVLVPAIFSYVMARGNGGPGGVGSNEMALRCAIEALTDAGVTFASQPVKCAVSCVVAVASAPPDASGWDATPALLLALRKCISECGGGGTAQLTLLCMMQHLDMRCRAAAVERALAPWDNRFMIHPPPPASPTIATPGPATAAVVAPQQRTQPLVIVVPLEAQIVEWVAAAVLRHPPTAAYQWPGKLRPSLRRMLVAAFVDAADLVAAQSAQGADVVAAMLLASLSTPTGKAPGSFPSVAPLSSSTSSSIASEQHQALVDTGRLALAAPGVPRFVTARAIVAVELIEKLRRTLFSAAEAAQPWGRLVPRRVTCETALAVYDSITLCSTTLAIDALALKSSAGSLQAMMQLTRRLIPLSLPFCTAAMESRGTVDALVDRFERSMRDVEEATKAAAGSKLTRPASVQLGGGGGGANGNPLFASLLASFTLTAMADDGAVRCVPNDVLAARWVPLLARACAAIAPQGAAAAGGAGSRGLLEIHCRNCCAALLRSRRTVWPAASAPDRQPLDLSQQQQRHATTTTTTTTATLYSGSLTTDEFAGHAASFLGWVMRPAMDASVRNAASRRSAASTFASSVAECVLSIERLETAHQGPGVGSDIATAAVTRACENIIQHIRIYTPQQIADPAERVIALDANSLLAQGIASCIVCLDDRVRGAVRHYVEVIMSTPVGLMPLESKKAVLAAMARAVSASKFVRGELRDELVAWLMRSEGRWLRHDARPLQRDMFAPRMSKL